MADENSPGDAPERWWITPYARSLNDFGFIVDREPNYFRHLDTICGLTAERRRLAKQMDVLLALSFTGAALMLAGGLPPDSKFSIFGVEAPSRLISLQLLGIGVAGIFTRFWQSLISLTLISQMLERVLAPLVGNVHVDFVVSRYDASPLWTNLMRRRDIGYQSPIIHKIVALTIPVSGLSLLIIHASIVIYALFVSLKLAFLSSNPNLILMILASFAFGMSVLSIFHFIMGFMVPLPFRMSPEMIAFLASEKVKAKATAAAHQSTLPDGGA